MRLREIRNERRLTVNELSQLTGVPFRTLQEIERRDQTTVATAKKIAAALNVTLDALCADRDRDE